MVAAKQGTAHIGADGALHVSALKPIATDSNSGSGSTGAQQQRQLLIQSALLSNSNVSHSTIHNSPSVSTTLLSVSGVAEFLNEVIIDGGVTVHGSVVGSGPYVDSSDGRLKRNVTDISNALDIVKQLRGVSSGEVIECSSSNLEVAIVLVRRI